MGPAQMKRSGTTFKIVILTSMGAQKRIPAPRPRGAAPHLTPHHSLGGQAAASSRSSSTGDVKPLEGLHLDPTTATCSAWRGAAARRGQRRAPVHERVRARPRADGRAARRPRTLGAHADVLQRGLPDRVRDGAVGRDHPCGGAPAGDGGPWRAVTGGAAVRTRREASMAHRAAGACPAPLAPPTARKTSTCNSPEACQARALCVARARHGPTSPRRPAAASSPA